MVTERCYVMYKQLVNPFENNIQVFFETGLGFTFLSLFSAISVKITYKKP